MRVVLIIAFLLAFVSARTQDFYVSPKYYPAQEEFTSPRPYMAPHFQLEHRPNTWWQNNKKGFAVTGIQLASILLDATGDALYDMGKESGNTSQMRWGHTLQASAVGTAFLMIPMIDWRYPINDGIFMAVSYVAMRYAIFDLTYNTVRGLDPLYATGALATMPPEGRVFTKTISLSLSIAINFKEF